MKLFKFSFADIGKKLQMSVVRFPLVYLCVLAVAVMLSLNIHQLDLISYKWIIAGGLSALAMLFVYLLTEERLGRLIVNGINVGVAALIVWFCSTFPPRMEEADGIQLVMLVASLVFALAVAPYMQERQSLRWWNYLQQIVFQLVITLFFAGVLMGGLSLALVSLDELFGMDVEKEVYQYLAVCCFVLFAPSYFMAQFPLKEKGEQSETLVYPNILKILGLYILLPILSIYILILYVYLLKIVITWELPNGWVSWLVSILGFVGLLTALILHPVYKKDENRVVNIYTRIFPMLLIPLLVLMFVGLVRRFSDYGITINRLLMLILNLWFFGISLYLFISKAKQPKWIFISFASIAFIASIGPWSVLNVTERTLKKEFAQLLSEAGWTNTKDYQPVALDEKKNSRLIDVAYYLSGTYGYPSINTMFSVLGENAGVSELLQALGIRKSDYGFSSYFSLNTPDGSAQYDARGYKTVVLYNKEWGNDGDYNSDGLFITLKEGELRVLSNEKETILSLAPFIEKYQSSTNNRFSWEDVTIEEAEYKLVVLSCEGNSQEGEQIVINTLKALLFVK